MPLWKQVPDVVNIRNIQGTFRVRLGSITFREHSVPKVTVLSIYGTFRERLGNIQGTLSEHLRNVQCPKLLCCPISFVVEVEFSLISPNCRPVVARHCRTPFPTLFRVSSFCRPVFEGPPKTLRSGDRLIFPTHFMLLPVDYGSYLLNGTWVNPFSVPCHTRDPHRL
jgi:hypothetical protein